MNVDEGGRGAGRGPVRGRGSREAAQEGPREQLVLPGSALACSRTVKASTASEVRPTTSCVSPTALSSMSARSAHCSTTSGTVGVVASLRTTVKCRLRWKSSSGSTEEMTRKGSGR